jgi:tetratricopeptide (TPR) repeat protein
LARQALQNQPERGSAHNHLGLALMRLGNGPAAALSLNRAIRLEPENGAYLWSAAQLAVIGYSNNDVALTFLEGAVRRGFSDFKAVYACEPLRAAVVSKRGQRLLQPQLMALCSKTLLNEQVIVSNLAAYPLTDLKLTLTLTHETAAGKRQETELVRQVAALSNGESVVMSSARATPNGTRSLMRLAYTCGEHPVQTFETTSCHNYLAQGENLWWQDYLARSTNGGPQTNELSLAAAADSGGTPLNSGQLRELLMRLVGFPR